VRRVYEASLNPIDLKAEIALRHALSSFRTLINDHEPTHVLPAFDLAAPPGVTICMRATAKARAHAAAAARCLAGFYAKLRGFGMHVVSLPEVEADDVIGTVVMRWLAEGRGEATIATTDKDLHA
jgi:DNA polymerase-1